MCLVQVDVTARIRSGISEFIGSSENKRMNGGYGQDGLVEACMDVLVLPLWTDCICPPARVVVAATTSCYFLPACCTADKRKFACPLSCMRQTVVWAFSIGHAFRSLSVVVVFFFVQVPPHNRFLISTQDLHLPSPLRQEKIVFAAPPKSERA